MLIDIAKGANQRQFVNPGQGKAHGHDKAARDTGPAPSTPKDADTVSLSPRAQAQSQALKTLESMNGAPPDVGAPRPAKTDAEQKAEDRFFEAVKTFFADRMGLDKNKIEGQPRLNREALRHLVRNTVLGALAPPGLLREMGLDMAEINKPTPKGGPLAEITIPGKEEEPALARVLFDPAAMEELANLPKKKKDLDGDRLFTVLDLMPAARKVESGHKIDNGDRFNEADDRFEKEDNEARKPLGLGVNRVVLSDGHNRPFFMTRLRGDVEKATEATVNICYSLLPLSSILC